MNLWICETQGEIWGHLNKNWISACVRPAKVSLSSLFPPNQEGLEDSAGISGPLPSYPYTPSCFGPETLSSLSYVPLQPAHWWWRRLCFPTERMWLPPGPADGGRHAGCLLHHGPALVCGCDCPVHHTCEQPQTGIWVLCPWRTAQILGYPRTESNGPYDLCADGLLSLHDSYIKGNRSFIH